MAKILHSKTLSDLDTNKEYLVYYYGSYSESGQPVTHNCDGFGKIKKVLGYSNWLTYLDAGPSYNRLSVKVISIDTSFIIEL